MILHVKYCNRDSILQPELLTYDGPDVRGVIEGYMFYCKCMLVDYVYRPFNS